ncbi:hypothetical protein ABT224_20230 [Streptomyces sp. NPDC001584]|uniref:hypothetical protein n=1 Tax=Streptomyces sp. NPDC001584 TaxID=3154521 RepID=UPI003323A4B6
MRQYLRAVANRLRGPKPTTPGPVTLRLTRTTAVEADTVLDWDGRYLGRLHLQGLILDGHADDLDRLVRELQIAAEVARAAESIDASRPGTLTPSGGEA